MYSYYTYSYSYESDGVSTAAKVAWYEAEATRYSYAYEDLSCLITCNDCQTYYTTACASSCPASVVAFARHAPPAAAHSAAVSAPSPQPIRV